MKTIIITALLALALAGVAEARYKCSPYMQEYFRSASGRNIVTVGWRCKGSGNGHSIDQNNICAVTENGERVCAFGFKRLSIKGGTTEIEFSSSQYPIKRIFLRK